MDFPFSWGGVWTSRGGFTVLTPSIHTTLEHLLSHEHPVISESCAAPGVVQLFLRVKCFRLGASSLKRRSITEESALSLRRDKHLPEIKILTFPARSLPCLIMRLCLRKNGSSRDAVVFPAGAHTLNACLFCGAYGSISESTRRRVTGCVSSKILLISFQRRRSSLAEATPSERVKSTYSF